MTSNDEMVELWNGEATAAWATHPDRYDVMLAPFGERVLAAADLGPGRRVLDVGCGAGALAIAASRAVGPTGSVVGADIARPLLDLARQRAAAANLRNVEFGELDVQTAEIGEPVDTIISRFGVMFFSDPVAAFANLHRHTRPGGRLAFVCWRPLGENEWVMVPVLAAMEHVGIPDAPGPDAPGPFAFGDADRVRSILGAAGWTSVTIDAVDLPINIGGAATAEDAVAYFREDAFGKALFNTADTTKADAASAALHAALAQHQTPAGVVLGSATWLVTASR